MLGFVFLHMFMYAADLYFWQRFRINYPFIFGFKTGTELGFREVFLITMGLCVMSLAGAISNLHMGTQSLSTLGECVPLILVVILLLALFCPFKVLYHSSRLFLLRSAFHCICVPFYKVLLPDFFLADQLTSQILNVLLRFAWIQSVMNFSISSLHLNATVAIIACLEIIRRGIWNFF
ncbi:hypothetical protein KI387_038600, partial [Taxus chinensis]